MQFFRSKLAVTAILFFATATSYAAQNTAQVLVPLSVETHRFQVAPSVATLDNLLSRPEMVLKNFSPQLPGIVNLKDVQIADRHILIKMSAMLVSIELSGKISTQELQETAACDLKYKMVMDIEGGTKARNQVFNNAKALISDVCYDQSKGLLTVSGFYSKGDDPSMKLLHDQAVGVLKMQINTIIEAIVSSI